MAKSKVLAVAMLIWEEKSGEREIWISRSAFGQLLHKNKIGGAQASDII